jgi:hypothetical protein
VARITHGALVANVVTDVTFDYNASSVYVLNSPALLRFTSVLMM